MPSFAHSPSSPGVHPPWEDSQFTPVLPAHAQHPCQLCVVCAGAERVAPCRRSGACGRRNAGRAARGSRCGPGLWAPFLLSPTPPANPALYSEPGVLGQSCPGARVQLPAVTTLGSLVNHPPAGFAGDRPSWAGLIIAGITGCWRKILELVSCLHPSAELASPPLPGSHLWARGKGVRLVLCPKLQLPPWSADRNRR